MRSAARSAPTPNDFALDLFSGRPDRYDLLAEVLSFGQNRRWRTTMVDAVAAMDQAPRRVLDVATGTGGVALMLSERTRASITGVDLTEQMLPRGRERIARRSKADRIGLLIARGEQVPPSTRVAAARRRTGGRCCTRHTRSGTQHRVHLIGLIERQNLAAITPPRGTEASGTRRHNVKVGPTGDSIKRFTRPSVPRPRP